MCYFFWSASYAKNEIAPFEVKNVITFRGIDRLSEPPNLPPLHSTPCHCTSRHAVLCASHGATATLTSSTVNPNTLWSQFKASECIKFSGNMSEYSNQNS